MKRKVLCGLMALMATACTAFSGCSLIPGFGGGDSTSGGTNNPAASSSVLEEGVNEFVFEAEYTNLLAIKGAGMSNEMENVTVITYDKFNADASNGYFVGYLYKKGCAVEFHIDSDKAVENVELILRATMEFENRNLTWEELTITVNGGDPLQYKTLKFTDTYNFFSMSGQLRPFSDFSIKNINLQEGENVIRFEVTNSRTMSGTASATGVIIDCIKLQTEADVTMEWSEGYPHADSLARIDEMENM